MHEQEYQAKRALNLLRTGQCAVMSGFCYLLNWAELWDGGRWWAAFFISFAAYYISETLMMEWFENPRSS